MPTRALDTALDALLARLEALERDHEALKRQVADLAARATPTRAPVTDQQLLSAIANVFGGSVFVVADLLESSHLELRETVNGASSRQLGAWLKRLRAHPAGPYVVQRIGRDDRGVLWALAAVSADRHTGA